MEIPVPDESIVLEQIEKSLKDSSPISATWDKVEQLQITDPRSQYFRRYKEFLSGVDAEKWVTRNYDNELNLPEVGSESVIWKNVVNQALETFNQLFPHLKANDLNDKNCASVTLDEITSSYARTIDNDVLMKNAILIDVICYPILKKFSGKIGDVGICCASESIRSKSKTIPLNYFCGKRTDLSGTTDWIMKRYGGNRQESSMFIPISVWVAVFMFNTCGNYGAKMAVDTGLAFLSGTLLDYFSAMDGERTSHTVDKTVLVNAVNSSEDRSLTTAVSVTLGMEMVVGARLGNKKKYNDVHKEVSSNADPNEITPTAYITSRYIDGAFMSFSGTILASDFGDAFATMDGSVFLPAIETSFHYNDLADAVMDVKYIETHNYVICAKANSNYSFSDHSEALYVALTTFDETCSRHDRKIKRRLCSYRCSNLVFNAMWPRYRACERARRYVSVINNEERSKLVQRGRRCIQGDVYIEENMWLDAICSNYNKRRAEIQERCYTETLLYVLGVDDDPSARDHIHSAVKAIGLRPFDTALEMVISLGAVWLAQLALRSIKGSVQYDHLVAEFSDLLITLSLSSMPIISDNTVTPCESICGPLCLRLIEMLTIVSEFNSVAGEAIMRTVASVIGMVSLDPFRCIAFQADMLLMSN